MERLQRSRLSRERRATAKGQNLEPLQALARIIGKTDDVFGLGKIFSALSSRVELVELPQVTLNTVNTDLPVVRFTISTGAETEPVRIDVLDCDIVLSRGRYQTFDLIADCMVEDAPKRVLSWLLFLLVAPIHECDRPLPLIGRIHSQHLRWSRYEASSCTPDDVIPWRSFAPRRIRSLPPLLSEDKARAFLKELSPMELTPEILDAQLWLRKAKSRKA